MGTYFPATAEEQKVMLEKIGLEKLEDLYNIVPKELIYENLDIPDGQSELEVRKCFEDLAAQNKVFAKIFRGAGAYNHYIPALVKQIASKEEFVTSYTPYQAEISQGLLQAIFEYQTMICELTDMEASNASVYDGATAAAEAVAMCQTRKKTKVLVAATSHPMVISVIKTYCFGSDLTVEIVPEKDGLTDLDKLSTMIDDQTCCFYLPQPNFFGLIEDADKASQIVHENKMQFIMGVNPIATAILKTPGEYGADIAVGEGQPLGLPLSFGGPYLGFMTTNKKLMRKLPGRIVGETSDNEGKRGYVLTMQAREQHIRREKATSNICSNQSLCALTAGMYMTVMGPKGVQNVAKHCLSKAHYAAEKISAIPGFKLKYQGEFFNEFITTCPVDSKIILEKLAIKGMLGGFPIADAYQDLPVFKKQEQSSQNEILWCFTEMNSKEDIDELVEVLAEVVK